MNPANAALGCLRSRYWALALGAALIATPLAANAFTSGSTGADGDLAPAVDTVVALPPSGIFNYTSINIPANVTVRFRRNTTNTPVVLLVSGNVMIAGNIDVSGGNAAASGNAGDGVLADDGNPGQGGPGGFDGGRGGRSGALDSATRVGASGLGPGGGGGGLRQVCHGNDYESSSPGYTAGGGGGFAQAGAQGGGNSCIGGLGGLAYGQLELIPVLGGSGGGGGAAGLNWAGSGGGGGGGALLIAASGTITISGGLHAKGGMSGAVAPAGCSGGDTYSSSGGGGSGGSIRLVATTITGNGTIDATGGGNGSATCGANGGDGSVGRIRLESEVITRAAGSTPASSFAKPGPVFLAGGLSLLITRVAGLPVSNQPSGVADVRLPAGTVNPVTVELTTVGAPPGQTVQVSMVPTVGGAPVSVNSTPLVGSQASATASAAVALPAGASTLQASISFSVELSVGQALARFAMGEVVQRIRLTAGLDGHGRATLLTASGREIEAPPEALRVLAWGG